MRVKLFREKKQACLCLGAQAVLCVDKCWVCFLPWWKKESQGAPWDRASCRQLGSLQSHAEQIISSRAKNPPLLSISCSMSGHHHCKPASPSRQRVTVLFSIPKSGESIFFLGGGGGGVGAGIVKQARFHWQQTCFQQVCAWQPRGTKNTQQRARAAQCLFSQLTSCLLASSLLYPMIIPSVKAL